MDVRPETVSIGEVTQWLSGGTPNRSVAEHWMGEVPWISASTLRGSEIYKSDQHLTPEAVAVGSTMAPVGATLFLVRGSALYHEIRAGLVVAHVCFNQDVKALVPTARIAPKFLTYSLLGRTQDLLKLVSTAGNSAGVLDTKLVQSFEIFLPPMHEQRVIAEAMSDTDRLVAALEALIAKKRAIKQATMHQLIAGKARLPGVSDVWKTRRIGDLADVGRGASPRPIDSPIWFDDQSTIGWLRISDVTAAGKYLSDTAQNLSTSGIANSRFVRRGHLVMSICATVGRPVITRKDVCIHDGFVVFRKLQVNVEYLYYVLSNIEGHWSKHGQTGSQMNLNTGIIVSTPVPLPDVSEQTAIATLLSDMDAEIAALERRLEKTLHIKQGMMQQLLTGRVRLVEPWTDGKQAAVG